MLHIRPLKDPDLPYVVQMIHALAAHHGDRATLRAAQLRRIAMGRAPWAQVLVAQADNELLGYAALCPQIQLVYGRKGLDMQHLFVRADHRGQGVGRALIAACIQAARAQGCAVLSVGTHPGNATAAQVYRATGFQDRPPPGPRFAKML